MSQTKKPMKSNTFAASSSKRIAGALLAAVSLSVMGPGIANAVPGATTIYRWECPRGGSAAVRCVQWVMTKYANHPLDEDGCYGEKSQAAVEDLQRFFDLDPVDAIVGPDTGSALDTVMFFNSSDEDFYGRWMSSCYWLIPTNPRN